MKSSNYNHTQKPKRKKRKLRSEAVVVLTLGSLLLFLLTSMSISVIVRAFQKDVVEDAPIVTPVIKNEDALGLIVLDPGHGGYDAGCNVGTIYEKDITLKVAKFAGDYLVSQGYQVIYTREEDVSLGTYEIEELNHRVYIGSSNQADYFVSLHLNSSEIVNERIYGFDIYENYNMDASMNLASKLNDSLSALQYTQSRGIKDGSVMHVVDINPIPAVLIEMGFLDDSADRLYLTSANGQKALGEAIGKGIIAAYNEKS